MKLSSYALAFACLLLHRAAPAQESPLAPYPRELSLWSEMSPLPERDAKDNPFQGTPWDTLEWHVFRSSTGEACAEPLSSSPTLTKPAPKFVPKATKIVHNTPLKYNFVGCKAYHRIHDGWLIAFNRGEFGAALYWFSEDGSKSYEISGHQVVEFAESGSGIFAVEGLSHMATDEGSVIRIEKPGKASRWNAIKVATLPSAPYTVSTGKEGTLFITFFNSLVTMKPDGKLETILPEGSWDGVYPNSSLLSDDETKLYIGMRPFVLEVNLKSRALRYLLPDPTLLNKQPN